MSKKSIGWIMVVLQFALLAVILFLPRGWNWPVSTFAGGFGNIIMFIGVGVALWAILEMGRSLSANPVPDSKATLKTTGPFAFVRHPIYSGILLASVGVCIAGGSWIIIGCTVALAVLLFVKARFEENMLLEHYEGYAEYAARVGRFIPGLGRIKLK